MQRGMWKDMLDTRSKVIETLQSNIAHPLWVPSTHRYDFIKVLLVIVLYSKAFLCPWVVREYPFVAAAGCVK